MGGDDPVFSVRELSVRIGTARGVARVVNGISYDVRRGETLAIVGESGSGKTVSALALMRLLPEPPARLGGRVLLDGVDLLTRPESELCRIRGNRIAMIFQDPMTSLNPVLTIGEQVSEPLSLHLRLSRAAARERAVDLLDLVGIPSPGRRFDDYPHQFSGGMRQRVMIAMALACDPEVLVADEATTALDVTTQAQILDLISDVQQRNGMAVVWITHDLGVVAGIADRVAVMYAGRVLEEGPVDDIYSDPRHPYTVGLLRSLPVPVAERPRRLYAIPGLPPDPVELPPGCPFWDRCDLRHDERAATLVPPLRPAAGSGQNPPANQEQPANQNPPADQERWGHRVACFYELTPADRHG